MTTERAQGRTIEAPVATMTTREGLAVSETKNYVNWSRLTQAAEMVTDDAPRVLRMLAQNDGQKPVALDHVRDAWKSAQSRPDPPSHREPKHGLKTEPGRDREMERSPGSPDWAGVRLRGVSAELTITPTKGPPNL